MDLTEMDLNEITDQDLDEMTKRDLNEMTEEINEITKRDLKGLSEKDLNEMNAKLNEQELPENTGDQSNVSWQIEELVLNQQKVETTCRDMTSYNCTDIPWTETVRVPVQKTRIVPQTRSQCQNIRVPGEAETRQIPITRIVYKEQCYNMPSTVCSTGAACGQQPQPQRCPYNQVACPFSNQQNAYRNVTICPLTGQPIGQPAYNPNQRPDMYPGQGFNPNQRPNMYPSPSPCQAVRQLACGAAPGGSCGAQQQCCRQVMRKVCQRVPQKVVETQTVTRPTWKWEQRCDNITFSRTEYYTETETKEIPRTRQDCRKVSENKCFNITIPEYGVRTQDRSQMVSVQLPRCQPRTEQATYCHNFPTGDTECKRIPIKKGFRINKVVCDKEASRPYCVNIPRMDCELKPGTSCRMVPETVSVPTCNESPQCQQCNNFTQGPGFGSCPTSTCDAYIDPNAEGNVPGSFPMVPGQTLDPFTKLPGQTLDPFIANGSMGDEGELVELGCQGTGGSDGQGRTFYPCPSGGTGGTFTPGTGCKNCYGCEGSCGGEGEMFYPAEAGQGGGEGFPFYPGPNAPGGFIPYPANGGGEGGAFFPGGQGGNGGSFFPGGRAAGGQGSQFFPNGGGQGQFFPPNQGGLIYPGQGQQGGEGGAFYPGGGSSAGAFYPGGQPFYPDGQLWPGQGGSEGGPIMPGGQGGQGGSFSPNEALSSTQTPPSSSSGGEGGSMNTGGDTLDEDYERDSYSPPTDY